MSTAVKIHTKPRFIAANKSLGERALSSRRGMPLRLSEDDLERLEAVIEESKDEFTGNISAQLRHLRRLIQEIDTADLDRYPAIAYQIKGLAGMFGYQNMTNVASMLLSYTDNKSRFTRRQLVVVGIHIDLLYVILAKRLTKIAQGLEAELTAALSLLVTRWP
jgi:chemotaxis protein histidine kinase CheA